MPSKGFRNKSSFSTQDGSVYAGRPPEPTYKTGQQPTLPTVAPPRVSKKIPPDNDTNWVERTDPSYVSNFRNNPVGDFGFKR